MYMNSLEYAINMEMESKKFYLEQAEKTADNGLRSIFTTLAEEESIHARILKNKEETLPYELIDTYAEIKNIFVEIGSYKSLIEQLPDGADVYRLALENERKSVALYKEILDSAKDDKDKKILTFLIEQEQDHCKVIEQLVEMVNRPKS